MFERPEMTRFLTPQHPKTSLAPTEKTVARYLADGWWGQRKVNGRRAQVHVEGELVQLWTRQGTVHTTVATEQLRDELRRYVGGRTYTVLDGEWLQGKLYLFDILRSDGRLLNNLNYRDRYELLKEPFISPVIQVLPVYRTARQCWQELQSKDPGGEGLVFRDPRARGWFDGAIVRCRREGALWSLTST